MKQSSYDRYPCVAVSDESAKVWMMNSEIFGEIKDRVAALDVPHPVVTLDTYPGVDDATLLSAIREHFPYAEILPTVEMKLPESILRARLDRYLTDDRIFGVMSCHRLEEFFDPDQLREGQRKAVAFDGELLIVYGVGASLVHPGHVLIYADMARWEIQLRYRRGLGNWGANNGEEDFFRKYKRSFFIEWRVADRHKFAQFDRIDYFLDSHQSNCLKMITGDVGRSGFAEAVHRPFRVVPFFDPAPWGGQWLKNEFDLPSGVSNYGWGFDCVPEENSLYLEVAGERIEFPALNVVNQHPVELLGDAVHARFGREFPIRFDFLDTMDGGNLSLQVHPLTEYIQQTFGMHYTQDESYYILEAGDDSVVYLGLKDDVDREAMIHDLKIAQTDSSAPFPAERYVNLLPAHKHDHFLIPAGTVHCSGKNTVVLEISATPYIFTFKMWDWNRLGLDGLPRPVHLQHGIPSIQWNRKADWTRRELVNRIEPIDRGDGWREERTGLHVREFIETRRHWFTGTAFHETAGSVNVLNLVAGREAIVESPSGAFAPFVVHYAETFIIPAAVGAYTIRPHGNGIGQECATIKASVRI